MLKRDTFIVAATVGLVSAAPVWGRVQAPPPTVSTIRQEVEQALNTFTFHDRPGVAILIARGDKVVVEKFRGLANIELGSPLTSRNVFAIASITKMFTAAAIVSLAQDGRLSLDDRLSVYLPTLSFSHDVTLRQLLNHTAGISDRAVDPQPGYSRRDVNTASQVAEIGRRPLEFVPGQKQVYSNSGYILLGAVIEAVADEPWYDFMQHRFFTPLGMSDTRYGQAGAIIPRRASGYTGDDSTPALQNAGFISMTIPAAAGGLVSTVRDLRLWMRALANGRVVGPEGFLQMQQPVRTPSPSPDPYGFGTYVWNVRGETMIGHSGQINGFASVLAYIPAQDITVVVLANDDRFDAQTMGRRLAAIAIGAPYPVADRVAMPVSEMRALVGRYQADDAPARSISIKDGMLHAQRGAGNAIPIQMTTDGQLHFVPDALTYFVPIKDQSGRVIALDQFRNGEGPPMRLNRKTTSSVSSAGR